MNTFRNAMAKRVMSYLCIYNRNEPELQIIRLAQELSKSAVHVQKRMCIMCILYIYEYCIHCVNF